MKLKKKKTLQIFFMIKDLNPFFFELLTDSIRDFNKNLVSKNKRIIKSRRSNKTITLFPIYLNLFSTTKNTQVNKERVYRHSNSVDLIKKEQKLLSKVLNKEVEPPCKFISNHLYLSRYNKNSTLQRIKSIQKLQNLKMI